MFLGGPMNCDHCVHYIKTGETMVPWGNTMVSAGDEWGSSENQEPDDDCDFEPEEPHYTIRSYSRDELAWGDMQGDMDREEGRC